MKRSTSIKDKDKEQTNYETMTIAMNTASEPNGKRYVSPIIQYGLLLTVSIICVAELIFLCRYFDSTPSLNACFLQTEFSYFILAKLLCSIILISWIATERFFECNKTVVSLSMGVLVIILLTSWSTLLTVDITNYRNGINHHDAHCNQLTNFIIFEVTTVYIVFILSSCVGCGYFFSANRLQYSSIYNMYG